MPMTGNYKYHGRAFGVDAHITAPGPFRLDCHGKCEVPDGKSGHYKGTHQGYSMPNGLSHGACQTEVNAMPEANGFFRTEIRATVDNFRVDGTSVLTIDRIAFGMVTVYRRDWYDRPSPHAKRTRVLPMECSLQNIQVNGRALSTPMPAPFLYPVAQREGYLTADEPDAQMDAEVRQTIIDSPSRSIYIPNFGRIFFCEWTLIPNESWHHVHQIAMVRMAFSSPPSGDGTGGGGQGDGSGG